VPAPPADQVASAVAALHVGADGTSHVTIRLAPEELGQVEIRISRAQDGTSSVSVAVERPETLATLQNDVGHLHQALDRAGVGDQRSVSMHLAPSSDAPGNTSFDTSAGFTSQGGSQQGGRQDRQPSASPAYTSEAPAPAAAPAPAPRRAGLEAGINITA
jgi:flagellar hook-length control protein FliK